jgi:NDP-sugar pyrophosphorylase family protein
MKAMIFAAGVGSRLKPLTDFKPKALVEIEGKPLLFYAIKKLAAAGCTGIIVNVHHFANQIVEYLHQNDNFGIDIQISDETDLLLDTGGGLKKASWFFSDASPFFVYNVDVISDISLDKMLDVHAKTGSMATLAVMNRQTSRYLLWDNDFFLAGWRNKEKNIDKISRHVSHYNELAFSGIQVLNPIIFSYFKHDNPVFSILDLYLDVAKYEKIAGYNHSGDAWFDLGKYNEFDKAVAIIRSIEH